MTAGSVSATQQTARPSSWSWSNRDLLATPIIVLIGLVVVFAYAAQQDFESVAQRILNPPALVAATIQQLFLTGVSTLIVMVIAIPLGVALSRDSLSRVRPAVLVFGGFLQALPPFGVIILFGFSPLGLGPASAVAALVVASFLPVLTSTVVGLRQVDPALIEAARGMGMSAPATLLRVELPLGVPVIVAGIRVALVLNMGTATLAAVVGGGGLGGPLLGALELARYQAAFVVAAIVAALALLIDWLAGVAERLVRGS
jgi:osmoprotectant transport system permease protein